MAPLDEPMLEDTQNIDYDRLKELIAKYTLIIHTLIRYQTEDMLLNS